MKIVINFLTIFFLIFCIANIGYSSDRIDTEKEKLSSYKKMRQNKNIELKEIKKREKEVVKRLNQVEKRLADSGKKLVVLKVELQRTQSNVDYLKQNLTITIQDLRKRQILLMQRLQSIHKYKNCNGVNIFFDSANFSDFAKRFYFMCLIAQADVNLIKGIREQKKHISQQKGIIEKKYDKINMVKQSEQIVLKNQAQEAKERRILLSEVRNKKTFCIAQIKKLDDDARQLTNLIKRLELKRREKKRYADKQRGSIKISSSYRSSEILPWPVRGGTVIQGFGRYKHPQFNVDIINKGIDILAPRGERVYAVKQGEVVFANWFKGYGMLVMIDHGQGLYSLYAHLSDILTSEGAGVSAGTAVGRVGNTGSIEEFSLHFELRVDGKPVDPLGWLKRR